MKKLLSIMSIAVAAAAVGQADELYHFIKEIPVGGEGGWDYSFV